jgi:hypothetical protein
MRTTMEKFWQRGTEPNTSSWAQMLQIDEHGVDAQSVEETIPPKQEELKTMMTKDEFTIEAIAPGPIIKWVYRSALIMLFAVELQQWSRNCHGLDKSCES